MSSNIVEATVNESSSSSPPEDEGDVSVHAMKKIFSGQVRDGKTTKSVWAMTLETFGMADGWAKDTDQWAETDEEALEVMARFIQQQRQVDDTNNKKKKNKVDAHSSKWDMPWSPLEDLNVKYDDIVMAFCRWSKHDEPSQDDESYDTIARPSNKKMNISKAFRRLQAYVDWMETNQKHFATPITTESIAKAARMFGMLLSLDASGRLVWWFDVKTMDIDGIHQRKISVSDSIRFLVWMVHVAMLERSAQDNGMMFVEDLQNVGFWKFVTAFPMEVGTQMDRLTIGVLPLKMKAIYVLNPAGWMKVLLNIMKPFMSKKMRKRIIVIGKKQDPNIVVEALGGPAYIPTDCCGLGGTMEKSGEIIFGRYIPDGMGVVDDTETAASDKAIDGGIGTTDDPDL